MVKKNLLKVFSIILAVITVFSSSVLLATAEDSDEDYGIAPCYTTINIGSCGISISGITATCKASLSAKESTSLKIKMEIQKKKSSGYETVETWTTSRTGVGVSITEKRTINALSTYRLKVTFTAGSETAVQYDYA